MAFLSLHVGAQAEAGVKPEQSQTPAPSTADKAVETTARAEPFQQVPAWSIDIGRLGLLTQTSLLMGKPVKDRKEKMSGKVTDLILDLAAGDVVAVLVSSSAPGRNIPVPVQSFTAVSRNKFLLKVDRQVLESAPQLSQASIATWPDASLEASFRHFGQTQPPRRAGAYCSGAVLIGAPLHSQDHQHLGQLKDIMVDVPTGRIVYLVVEPSDKLASNDALFVVPPVKVQADVSGGLVLKTGREQFLAGPHFSSEFWTDMAFPEMASAVCKHYSVAPLGTTESRPTASVVAGRESSAGPSPAAPVPSDQQITQAVLAAIVRSGGSGNSTFVITTLKGRVTLSGTVRNEKEKKQVAEAAERVVGAANVEDRLELWGKARTAQL